MLITKNIIIPISKYSKYYLDKGVLNKEKNTIEIDISILRKNASTLIEAECDICNNKKKISFKNYNENIKKYNIFSCSKKCSLIKTKKTNLEKCIRAKYNTFLIAFFLFVLSYFKKLSLTYK